LGLHLHTLLEELSDCESRNKVWDEQMAPDGGEKKTHPALSNTFGS
jgi:hypothetical protein